MARPTKRKVKYAAAGAAGGGAASAVLQILAYYMTPLVPADIYQPAFFLLSLLVTAALSYVGAWWVGWAARED